MRGVGQVKEVQLLLRLDTQHNLCLREEASILGNTWDVGIFRAASAAGLCSVYCRAVQQVPLLMVSDPSRPSVLLQSLFPDNTYRHDSGGDPTQIPDLKFEEFQDFHSKYYHPSNAK